MADVFADRSRAFDWHLDNSPGTETNDRLLTDGHASVRSELARFLHDLHRLMQLKIDANDERTL